MQTFQVFEARSGKKIQNAYFMLVIAITIVIVGLFFFIRQVQTSSSYVDEAMQKVMSSKDLDKGQKDLLIQNVQLNQVFNLVTRLVFMIIVFFIAQIFLKLYRHNMNLSDFYYSCVDAWKLNGEIEYPEKKEQYIKLLKAIYPNEIKLGIPNSPDVSGAVNLLKKE
jgi:hypothetical protein